MATPKAVAYQLPIDVEGWVALHNDEHQALLIRPTAVLWLSPAVLEMPNKINCRVGISDGTHVDVIQRANDIMDLIRKVEANA